MNAREATIREVVPGTRAPGRSAEHLSNAPVGASEVIAQRVHELLNRFEQVAREVETPEWSHEAEVQLFRARFRKHAEVVVRPVMTGIGEVLKSRGHNFEIQLRELPPTNEGFKPLASIALTVCADRRRVPVVAPEGSYIGFHALPEEEQVEIRLLSVPVWSPEGCLEGFAHADAERCDVADLTPRFVEDKILRVLEAVFRRPCPQD